MSNESKVFSIVAGISAVAAAKVSMKLLDKSWTVATGKKPPQNPADPDVEVWEAVAWAAATGVAVGLARMFAQRAAANYFAKSTGDVPPQLAKDGQDPDA